MARIPRGYKLDNIRARDRAKWFKDKCRKIAASEIYLQWALDVVEGRVSEKRMDFTRHMVEVPVSIADRKSVWESMRDTGFGHSHHELDAHLQGLLENAIVILPAFGQGKAGETLTEQKRIGRRSETNDDALALSG